MGFVAEGKSIMFEGYPENALSEALAAEFAAVAENGHLPGREGENTAQKKKCIKNFFHKSNIPHTITREPSRFLSTYFLLHRAAVPHIRAESQCPVCRGPLIYSC